MGSHRKRRDRKRQLKIARIKGRADGTNRRARRGRAGEREGER